MKKYFCISHIFTLCFLFFLIVLFPSNAFGDYTDIYGKHCSDTEYNYIISSDNTITIEKYIGSNVNVNIPNSINGLCVTKIGSEAFRNNSNIQTVVVPSSVTSISSCAFQDCINLKRVDIKSSNITHFFSGIFTGTKNLSSIYIYGNTNHFEGFVFPYQSNATVFYPSDNSAWNDYASKYKDIISFDKWNPATGEIYHNILSRNYSESTCEKSGSTEEQYCKNCGLVIKKSEVIPSKGHQWSDWNVINSATIYEQEVSQRKCLACNKTESKVTAQKLKPTIKLSKRKIALKKKQFKTIKIIKISSGDSVKKWISSNKKIAKVNKNGKVTAVKKGKAKITVVLKSGKKANVIIYVK